MRALVLFFLLVACAAAPDPTEDWRSAALFYCLGDGAPPATGSYSSGGELAACQALVRDREGRR
jgi:hypothetical protein